MHIGRYILRRGLWLIPTIFILIWLTGLLQDALPGDPVEIHLQNADFSFDERPWERRARYNEKASELKLNMPSFYFTITPQNISRSKDLEDLRLNHSKDLWLKSHDHEEVDGLYDLILTQINALPDTMSSEERSKIYNGLILLAQSGPKRSFDWDKLENSQLQDDIVKDLKSQHHDALESDVGVISSFPSLHWHGSQNRFHNRMANLITGKWGKSKVDGRPVSEKVKSALTWTMALSVLALLLALALALILAWVASIYDHSLLEKTLSMLLFTIYAIPVFWLATVLIVFFTTEEYGSWTNIFPNVGIFMTHSGSILKTMLIKWQQLILPVLCLALGASAYFYRFILEGNREEKKRPYFLAALCRGLSMRSALTRHAFINTIFPLVGLMALIIPGLIGGSLIIEVLFNIPGMGRLMYGSILSRDWNIVIAVVFLTGVLTFFSMILIDIVLHWINPKFRIDG
ncbi:MAG: ABC transporter permease [Saprospiraceae bacterium]|nr:ABC transporter permease [Saprospiraceae bacterium]